MDEIEYKLNTKNSVLVVNAVEKLITTVQTKFKPAERQRFVLENEELKFLREKCSSKDTVISLTACQGLLALVESGVLEIGHTMSTVITLLPSAQNYSAIISTMAGLLVLDLKSRLVPGQSYKCQFSLRSPQHPFITVLERNKEATEDILTQMHALCNHPDFTVSSNSLELLQPVFLWLSCNPQRCGGPQPWQLLLSLQQNAARDHLLLNCISWQQTGNPKLMQSVFMGYSAVTETAIYQRQRELLVALLPMLARLSNQLIKNGGDPRACYSLLERCCSSELPELKTAAGLTVASLADNLTVTCAPHLHQLFNLGLNMIIKYECPSIAVNTFVALSLQWLHLPSTLTHTALTLASKILDTHRATHRPHTRLDMTNLQANKTFLTLLHTDRNLSITFRLFKTWERIRDDPKKLRSWFDGIERIENAVQLDLVSFLMGIVMERREEEYFKEISLRALRIVIRMVDVRKELSVQLLPVVLYKIANDPSPNMKLECLRALPLMAKTKENVPTVVSILNKLRSSGRVPAATLIQLFTSLAEQQARCFPYLHEMLVDGTQTQHDLKWEVELARSLAVKRICQLRSSQGIELVPVISSILNRCTDSSSALAAAHALDSLRYLWRHSAVAPASTWTALQHKLSRDKRPQVQISVCKLLAEAPQLRVSTAEYDAMLAQAARHLWHYVAQSSEPHVVGAACDALAQYTLAMYTLKDVPEVYRRTVKLPASHCKTPADAARRPEDVLDYIPCEIWPEVFKYTCQTALDGVRRLTTALIDRELQGYRSGVYQAPAEPQSLAYLPASSVLRGLADFIRKQATSPSYDCPDAVLLEMLRSVASEYRRPLPPLDLSFLHSVFHRGAHWRQPCVELAARQAHAAPSARLLLDNYLLTLHAAPESEILMVFELLPALCRSMPPLSLRGPLERCLADSYTGVSGRRAGGEGTEGEDPLFVRQVRLVGECLRSARIHDANRTLLAQLLEAYLTVIADDNVSWASYVTACTALPVDRVERMTSPLSWWEVTGEALRKAASIRCALAAGAGADASAGADSDASLVWLNEIIDAAALCAPEQEYISRCMMSALQAARATRDTRDWLLQLMARTQVAFTETVEETAKWYYWDVFVLSVVMISGHWSFEPDSERLPADRALRLAMFPAAIASLLQTPQWMECAPQVLECLCHTRNIHTDSSAALACQRALMCMKHSAHFATAFWTKAVHDKRLYD